MDIKPPKNWRSSAQPPATQNEKPIVAESAANLPIAQESAPDIVGTDESTGQKLAISRTKRSRRFIILSVVISSIVFIAIVFAALAGWYLYSLQPRDSNGATQAVTIEQGMTPRSIGALLDEKQLIHNKYAFELYTTLAGLAGSLQAGSYKLSPAQSVPDIVNHLTKGMNDTYTVTILPGMTLADLANPDNARSFVAQGFSSEEIKRAFAADYTSPLLASRPKNASLEGYIFPETYQLQVGDSLQSLIQRSIDELNSRVEADGLVAKFKTQGLSVHQAVTLASIVQQEVSNPTDQAQVAQVFLKRLSEGMKLGSDVTALYGAQYDGVALPDNAAEAAVIAIDHDSPYNTRMHSGLPPGPIATMNYSALEAVASPAKGEYLYFVAGDGDDAGRTFFSRTYEEHQAAVAAHCHTLCGN